MKDITIEQVALIVAGIVAFAKGIEYILDLLTRPSKKVKNDMKNDIDIIKKDVKWLDENKADKKDIESIRQDITMLLKCQFALLEHASTGNHTKEMDDLRREMQEYIILK